MNLYSKDLYERRQKSMSSIYQTNIVHKNYSTNPNAENTSLKYKSVLDSSPNVYKFKPSDTITRIQVQNDLFELEQKIENLESLFPNKETIENPTKKSSLYKTYEKPALTLRDLQIISKSHEKINPSKLREKQLEYEKLKKELIQARLQNSELSTRILKFEHQWNAKKSAFIELKKLQTNLQMLKAQFSKSEEVRKSQKTLIKDLKSELRKQKF